MNNKSIFHGIKKNPIFFSKYKVYLLLALMKVKGSSGSNIQRMVSPSKARKTIQPIEFASLSL